MSIRRAAACLVTGMVVGMAPLRGTAFAENAASAMRLTDAQLDRIVAGTYLAGSGTGSATGITSDTAVSLTTIAGVSGESQTAAVGQVTARATSSGGALATASSTLSLTVFIP